MVKIILILILSVLALMLVLTGMGFLISALYLYLVSIFHNNTLGAVFCGLAIVLLAIVLLLIVLLIKSSLFKFKSPKLNANIKALKQDPGAEAMHLMKEYPFQSAMIGLGAGFLVGFFPKLRNTLIDGITTYLNHGSLSDYLKSLKSKQED